MPLAYQVLLFVLAAAYVLTLVWIFRRQPARYAGHVLTCPETRGPVEVEVDSRHALVTLLQGVKELRLKQCSRWPERAGCDEACLLQLDTAPAVLTRVMANWCEGRNCAVCNCAVTARDWESGRLGLLDRRNNLVELREIRLDQLPNAFDHYRPLCWSCHQVERSRRPAPAVFLKGDRRPRAAQARMIREW
jgi:hypothetical protein